MKSGNKNKGPAHNRFKHGMVGSRVYKTWQSMRARCYRKTSPDYKNYGARGITVCERWHSFENFLADMGEPSDGMTLERVDVNGDYCPENCIWSDRTVQSRNRRYVKMDHEKAAQMRQLRAQGATLEKLAEMFGIGQSHAGRIVRGEAWV